MYWLYVFLISYVVLLIVFIVGVQKDIGIRFIAIVTVWSAMVLCLFIPLVTIRSNIESKYDWYLEIRLKYAESEGIEKMYLEMNDVMTYNLWYERNKEDLENPWNLKNAAGREFDYIKIGD